MDLGKVKKKKVKALRRGEGDLVDEIRSFVLSQLGEAKDDQVLPIVFLFEKKAKKTQKLPIGSGLLPRLR